MTDTSSYILLGIYLVALSYVTVFCLVQFQLLWYYLRAAAHAETDQASAAFDPTAQDTPLVTVQLPVYNEMYVIERLIDCVCAFDYPRDKLEVQILDDSTDDTSRLIADRVRMHAARGVHIEHLTRPGREGYKAGALRYGLETARGDLLVIFDADFLPQPDFLRLTVPHFRDPGIGVVQTRWEHINEDYSVITRLQALQLNVHFTIEQAGRQAAGLFLQFNGTAGIWRRRAIEDAGGWHVDTLTEDLDLSYRAQLKGWRIRYLEEVGSPAELPAEMPGLKSQQFRWMKGGAETARKILPRLWRAPVGFSRKFHGTIHLLSSAIFVFVFVLAVVSVPVLFALRSLELDPRMFSIFLIGLLSIYLVYYAGNARQHRMVARFSGVLGFLRFSLLFPAFLALSMGLSLHNSLAVIQGYFGKQSAFIRTPKFNIMTTQDSFRRALYRGRKLSWVTIGEGLLAIYFLGAVIMGLHEGLTAFIFFHILLMLGFAGICYLSIRHLG